MGPLYPGSRARASVAAQSNDLRRVGDRPFVVGAALPWVRLVGAVDDVEQGLLGHLQNDLHGLGEVAGLGGHAGSQEGVAHVGVAS
jgi:hypothetical protein